MPWRRSASCTLDAVTPSIADLNARSRSDATLDRADVVEAVGAVLDDPLQLVAISAYGRRADLLSVVDDPARFDDAIARLTAGRHLVAGEFRLSPGSAAVFDAPVEAAIGVARRVIGNGRDGERRLVGGSPPRRTTRGSTRDQPDRDGRG